MISKCGAITIRKEGFYDTNAAAAAQGFYDTTRGITRRGQKSLICRNICLSHARSSSSQGEAWIKHVFCQSRQHLRMNNGTVHRRLRAHCTVHRTDQRAWHLFKEGDSRREEIADVSISWKIRGCELDASFSLCLICEVHPVGNDNNAILELGNSARKWCPLGVAVTVPEVGIHRGGAEIACQIWAEGIRLFYDPDMMVGSIFCPWDMGKQQDFSELDTFLL